VEITDAQPPPSAPPPEPGNAPPDRGPSGPDLFTELKRRKVYRVGAAYLAVVFGVLQAADLVFPALGLGSRVFNGVVLASLLGFPVVVALAWMFDITGGGIRRTQPVRADDGAVWPPDRWARVKAALVGGGFVAAAFLGATLWRAGPAVEESGGVPTERPVLAVLPFQDLSPEGDQEYFADGLHEEILHQLSVLRGLRLVSRTSVMHFRGSPATVGAIADSLGARYVVEGSVRRAEDSVRVTAQLIDAETDEHLWSESLSRAMSMDGLFDLERTLAGRLAGLVGGTLVTGQQTPGTAPTRSLEAYNEYLRGLYHWNQFTAASMEEAADDFQRALATDPEFGRAHAMLATVYVAFNNSGMRVRGELFPQIREHTALAMRYAPEDAETHFAQAAVHWTLEWDWEGARRELEEATALAPDRTDAPLGLAEWYGIAAGDTERGLELLGDAQRLDPLTTSLRNLRASILHFGRRYAEAAEEYRALAATDPAHAPNTMNVVSNLALSGQMEEATRIMSEALPHVRSTYGPTLAVHLARVGDTAQAVEVWKESLARKAAGAAISDDRLAAAAVAVGDLDAALTWLERSFDEEGGLYTLRDPLWDPIRNDPRFQAIWDRVGLPGPPPGAGG
jgi:TolB-like protein/Tfp pilus assembly protein PilF